MIRIDENSGRVPSEQLMNDMGKLIEEMTREGTLSAVHPVNAAHHTIHPSKHTLLRPSASPGTSGLPVFRFLILKLRS